MICLALIVLFQVVSFGATEATIKNNVYVLDATNFVNFFEKSGFEFIVLKYFKNGCPACANFQAIFEDLAKTFVETEPGQTKIAFAEVNVMERENAAISHYLFKDPSKPAQFPTVKLYYKGLDNEVIFNEGQRTTETLTAWIKKEIESKSQEQKSEL